MDMSYRLGWIDDSIVKRVHSILKQAKLPIAPPEIMTVEMFKSVMAVRENIAIAANTFEALDKKNLIVPIYWECRLIRKWLMDC